MIILHFLHIVQTLHAGKFLYEGMFYWLNYCTFAFPHFSFGYSDKTALNGKEPIGIYGNGFKSGSMRLGSDAIVFSESKDSRCVGMLSQTYLEKINAQQIIVPIVCFEGNDKYILSMLQEKNKASIWMDESSIFFLLRDNSLCWMLLRMLLTWSNQ